MLSIRSKTEDLEKVRCGVQPESGKTVYDKVLTRGTRTPPLCYEDLCNSGKSDSKRKYAAPE